MNSKIFSDGGINSLVVYGPMSHVLSAFLSSVPREIPMIRIHGKTPPLARQKTRDIRDVDEVEDCLLWLQDIQPQPRIAFIGSAFVSQHQLLIQESRESLRRQLDINVSNYVFLVHTLLPWMLRARFGRFVYLSSFRAHIATRGMGIYSGAKAFGESFFRSVGIENGSFGITSVTIRMGYFSEGLLRGVSAERLSTLMDQTSLGRLGQPDDLSQALTFALGTEFTNGGVIEFNGGLSFT